MPEGKQLLAGYESNDYVINVVIKVTDRIGSSTLLWLNATVSGRCSCSRSHCVSLQPQLCQRFLLTRRSTLVLPRIGRTQI